MTATALLDYLAERLQAALVGWQVYPAPLPDTAFTGSPMVELGVAGASAADWRLSHPGIQDTLVIALTTPIHPHPDRYRQLVDARDAVLGVLHQERGYLMAMGVELGPPGVQVATLEPIQPVALAQGVQVWRAQVFVAARRQL